MITTGKMRPSVVRSGTLTTYDNSYLNGNWFVCSLRVEVRVYSGFIPVLFLVSFVCGNRKKMFCSIQGYLCATTEAPIIWLGANIASLCTLLIQLYVSLCRCINVSLRLCCLCG
jgi:hypothetical protein